MKALVKYNPEIHDVLIGSLDKEVEKSKKYAINGVSQYHTLLQKREINVAGRTIDLTKGLRNQVDSMATHSFSYHIKHKGELEIEFSSLNDRMPSILRKPAEKLMIIKIKSELKKEFKQDIFSVSKMEG